MRKSEILKMKVCDVLGKKAVYKSEDTNRRRVTKITTINDDSVIVTEKSGVMKIVVFERIIEIK